MGGKAKPTKHTAKELAQKERAERDGMSAFEAQMDEWTSNNWFHIMVITGNIGSYELISWAWPDFFVCIPSFVAVPILLRIAWWKFWIRWMLVQPWGAFMSWSTAVSTCLNRKTTQQEPRSWELKLVRRSQWDPWWISGSLFPGFPGYSLVDSSRRRMPPWIVEAVRKGRRCAAHRSAAAPW